MPLSISDVKSLREASAPLPATVSPCVTSDLFKSPEALAKPKSQRLKNIFNKDAQQCQGSALKQSASTTSHRFIPLGAGRPTADFYPWDSVTFSSTSIHNDQKPATNTTAVTKFNEIYNLSTALNYGNAVGSPPLVRFFTEHTEIVHDPPYSDWAVYLSCGSTAAFEVAFRVLCDRGDTVLMEEYSYPGALEAATMMGAKLQGIPMDAQGPRPEELERILSTWDEHASRSKKPRVFYTIPSGQNPTGVTQTLERKRAIYDIAERHDLIIIEDDPYYFLRLGRNNDTPCNGDAGPGGIIRESDFLSSSIPSYLAIDKTGRVIRLDSTSKILAPGLRAGWVTASAQIIAKLLAYQEVSTIAVNGPSQLMLWKLLDETWGHRGFFKWLEQLSQQYRGRLNIVLKACNQYLPKQICSWTAPNYGMFFWISINCEKHPLNQRNEEGRANLSTSEVEDRVYKSAFENGAQVTKGSMFYVNGDRDNKINFRLTFASAREQEMDQGVRIFANALREEFSLPSV
ncbi:unnamed protein product [Penicillium salamii]|uniref:Aminotransferase class I/classII large domain-containing protein n=1 Tax=Penicillium salamii TaxID=1612424 RepID=A0A9W4JMZ4_9EURO|nr:unnamed protein product [Penicillium salamii]